MNPREGNIYDAEGVEGLLRSVSAEKHRTVFEFKLHPRCAVFGFSSTGEKQREVH
jgi:hypothetical protein